MELYPHQAKVFDLLANEQSVILRAPTGAGKTQASIYPFLSAMDYQSNLHSRLPHKCIYSVPMRVLAKQFHAEYSKIVHRYNTRYNIDIETAIQTGEMPHDPELRCDLIFATIDQTLSSFLMAPYSLSPGKANLNLGAILSSYLVFDEFHLYDPDSTLPTVLQMLRMLQGITPFVLMTATFSDELIRRLAAKLKAEVVGLDEEDRASFNALQSQDKCRYYHAADRVLTADTVLEHHEGRSVVICNTVTRARDMASGLYNHPDKKDAEIILLHSQFLREDRDRIEDDIRSCFGKNALDNGSLIIVATQAIEVGVDITSTVMHTELAPANAIIQRAGRCARYEDDTGHVHIYRYVQGDDDSQVDLLEEPAPYVGEWQKKQMKATFEGFMDRSGEQFKFDDEQHIIDQVHSEADRAILNSLDANSADHRRAMFAAMRGDRDQVADLVRKVIAQPVTIHPNPESVEKPYRLPSFSLHPGTLRDLVNKWMKRFHNIEDDDEAPPFDVKYLHSETDPDNSTETIHTWEYVQWDEEKERASHIPYGTLVVVHPALASYSSTKGFLPTVGGGWETEPDLTQDAAAERSSYTYRLETYAEHIQLVYKAAFVDNPEINRIIYSHQAFWHELEWGAKQLEKRLCLSVGEIKRAAELTVLLHDVGKLSTGWQKWVRDYQAAIGCPVEANEAFAHTFYNPDKHPHHRDIQKQMRKRPPHAVESAVAASPVLHTMPESLGQAVFTAISRHHGAFTDGYKPFHLEKFAIEKVDATLDTPISELWDGKIVKHMQPETFIAPHDSLIDQFFAYALFVRLLRRADVKGTMWGSSSHENI